MILFVWDFHGVLEKGNEDAVIEISNAVLKNAGHKERFSFSQNEEYYGLKWYEYFKKLLPHLSEQECRELQQDCFLYSETHLEVLKKYIKPSDHSLDVLMTIKSSGNRQILLSNTRPSDLLWFVETVGVRQYFVDTDIVGVNAHEKHSTKLEALEDYLKLNRFSKIVCIGDSETDLEMGRNVGAINYFYKHPGRTHEKSELADYVISDLKKVLAELA